MVFLVSSPCDRIGDILNDHSASKYHIIHQCRPPTMRVLREASRHTVWTKSLQRCQECVGRFIYKFRHLSDNNSHSRQSRPRSK